MYQGYGMRLPFQIDIFRTMDEAMEWLGMDKPYNTE
jgi:hypothetical protein